MSDELYGGAGLPSRRPGLSLILDDFKEIKAGRPPKNKLLIGVVAIVALSVLISLLALVVSLFRGKPSELPAAGTSARAPRPTTRLGAPTGATTPTAAESAAATPPAPTAVATAETKPAAAEAVLGDCTMAGEAHVVSPRAFVQSGVEAVSVPERSRSASRSIRATASRSPSIPPRSGSPRR